MACCFDERLENIINFFCALRAVLQLNGVRMHDTFFGCVFFSGYLRVVSLFPREGDVIYLCKTFANPLTFTRNYTPNTNAYTMNNFSVEATSTYRNLGRHMASSLSGKI